jgi:TonB-dependent SusC/RagA subfamily outer membrane receptor
MYTPDTRRSVQWLIIAASVAAAGCASQPTPLALQPTTLPLNVRLTRPAPAPAPVIVESPAASRGDISLAESAHYVFMEQLLMARASGLEVRSLGQGRFTLHVRGRPALGERREPLVVVDGMQFGENGADLLAAITPRDVKRVEVLKDPASTGVYGTRGANGVVVVTTRRGDY